MYSFSYLEPVCCSMSSSNCCFLTCIQVSQEAGQVVWYSHLFQNFPVSCNPQSQSLGYSQYSRNWCFSGTTDWLQIGKGVGQGCILSPYLFNFYAEYIMRNAGLEETQAGIKFSGRNINNLRYADDTGDPYGRKQRRTKESLNESERGQWKSWLKGQHSKN